MWLKVRKIESAGRIQISPETVYILSAVTLSEECHETIFPFLSMNETPEKNKLYALLF